MAKEISSKQRAWRTPRHWTKISAVRTATRATQAMTNAWQKQGRATEVYTEMPIHAVAREAFAVFEYPTGSVVFELTSSPPHAPIPPQHAFMASRPIPEQFLVAFSFAGEQRAFVRSVAEAGGKRSFHSAVAIQTWKRGGCSNTSRRFQTKSFASGRKTAHENTFFLRSRYSSL